MAKHGGEYRDEPHLKAAKEAEQLAQGYTAVLENPEPETLDIDLQTAERLQAEAKRAKLRAARENVAHADAVILDRSKPRER